MIVRGPRAERDFTIIRNEVLRDDRLSFRARGVMAYLLSQPVGFRISADEVAGAGREGRDAIRVALREMQVVGYLRREKRRTADGRLMTDSVLYETPDAAATTGGISATTEDGFSVSGATCDDAPESDETAGHTGDWFTDVGKSGPIGSTDLEELEKDYPPPAGFAIPAGSFDRFWAAYPAKVAKGAARKAWPKALKAAGDAERIIAGAERYAVDPNREPGFTAHPSTWLNAERWDDDPLPPKPSTNRWPETPEPPRREQLPPAWDLDEHGNAIPLEVGA